MILTSLTCIALTVYHEARGEPYDGQLAVAEVVVNRIQDAAFPGDACAVMREDRGPEAWDCQFSFWCDGRSDRPTDMVAWAVALEVARDAEAGMGLGIAATHYHTISVSPAWADHMTPVGRIGNHVFYIDQRPLAPARLLRPKLRPERGN